MVRMTVRRKLSQILVQEFLYSLLLQKLVRDFWAPERNFHQISFGGQRPSSASINEVSEEISGKKLFLNLDFRSDYRN